MAPGWQTLGSALPGLPSADFMHSLVKSALHAMIDHLTTKLLKSCLCSLRPPLLAEEQAINDSVHRADKELVSILEGFSKVKTAEEKVQWAASALQLKDVPDPSR